MADENKVVLVGESGVGKTCIINQFIKGEYDDKTTSTISFQFCQKTFEFPGNKNIALDIWDTAGQEKYRSLNSMFYKNVKAAVLVYDITDKKSFEDIKNFWYDQIKQLDFWYNTVKETCKNIIIGVIGNKIDLFEEEEVDEKEAKAKAEKYNANFGLTSALNDDSGIDEIMENLVKIYIKSKGGSIEIENLECFSNNTLKLDKNLINNNEKNKSRQKKSKCCL